MRLMMRQRTAGEWFGIRVEAGARDGDVGRMLLRSGVVRWM
jgi:hypothetical protein